MYQSIQRGYDWLMSKGDPRIADWPLMATPFPILSIIACYVYTVKVLGPRWMANRKPYRIENIIIVYNLIMVVASALFFHYGGQLTYIPPGGKYSLICQPIDYSMTPEAMRLPHLVPWGVWIGLKFGAGGHNAFFPLINLAIHTIMYSYYCLAALGPSVRKYLWWKRYLTILQMIQFFCALVHACIPLVMDCGFQPFFAYAIIVHAIFFWIMFLNFYRKRYNTDNNLNDKKENDDGQQIKKLISNGNGQKPQQQLQQNGFKNGFKTTNNVSNGYHHNHHKNQHID